MGMENLSQPQFAECIGDKFRFIHPNGDAVDVVLVESKSMGIRHPDNGAIKPRVDIRSEPFSILFRGPKEIFVEQGMYIVDHQGMGKLEGLFLTPIGEDEDGIYYEAVFN